MIVLEQSRRSANPQARRPRYLSDSSILLRQTFVENPAVKRRKGWDRWVLSGGCKGATVIWVSPHEGVRRRYGRVNRVHCSSDENLKFVQYSSIRRTRQGLTEQESNGPKVWVLFPSTTKCESLPEVLGPKDTMRVHQDALGSRTHVTGPPPAALQLRASEGQAFLSFEAVPMDDSLESMELGAIIRGEKGGVVLKSRDGDFAEWHRRAKGEAPFSEGDVVGFGRDGCISRVTRSCNMIGVITRMAVVEGSAPPERERHLFDTVAYQGIVPVKVSAGRQNLGQKCDCLAPRAGQLLVPSGQNDGTAVLSRATEGVPRVGILIESVPMDVHSESGNMPTLHFMKAAVVSPPETVIGFLPSRTVQLWRLTVALVVMFVATSICAALWSKLSSLQCACEHVAPNATAIPRTPYALMT
jgi:hypothetical protein